MGEQRPPRLDDDALGALVAGVAIVALLFLASVFMRLRVEWCVAAGGDRATCAGVATLSGRR